MNLLAKHCYGRSMLYYILAIFRPTCFINIKTRSYQYVTKTHIEMNLFKF